MSMEAKPIGPGETGRLEKAVNAIGNQAKASYDKIQAILDKKESIDSEDMINAQMEMNKFSQKVELGSSIIAAANSANMTPARASKGQ